MTFKIAIGFLLGFFFLFPSSSYAQSTAEIDQVTKLTKRVQTKGSALAFLGGIAESKGDYKKARDNYKKMLEIYKNDPGIGPNSARYAYALSKIALCDNKIDTLKADASKVCKEALAIIEGQTPDTNPGEGNYVVMTRQNCAMILGKGMPAQSTPRPPQVQLKCIPSSEISDLAYNEKTARAALSSCEKVIKGATPAVLKSTAAGSGKASKEVKNALVEAAKKDYLRQELYLANICTLEKKYSDAEPLFKKVIAAIESKFGKNSPQLLTPLSNYGYMLKESGKEDAAEEVLKRLQQVSDFVYNAKFKTAAPKA